MNSGRWTFVILIVTATGWFTSSVAAADLKFAPGDYVLEIKGERNGAPTSQTDQVKIEIDDQGGVKIFSREIKERPPMVGKLMEGKLLVTLDEKGAKVTLKGMITAENEIVGDLTVQIGDMPMPHKGAFKISRSAAK